MALPRPTLGSLARGFGVLAVLTGGYGVLHMMGAFGPVSCWRSYSGSGSASSNGTVTTTTTVTRGCESGIDALLGPGGPFGGGNAGVLFSWSLVLAALVAVGGYGAWTGRRSVTWATVVVGTAITVIGVFSVGWFFLLPTILLLVAAAARSVEVRTPDE